MSSLLLLAAAAFLLTACGNSDGKGGTENFGSGTGKVYDRGGLPEDLRPIAVGSGGDGRTDTNVSVAGTGSNRPELSKPPGEQPPSSNQ